MTQAISEAIDAGVEQHAEHLASAALMNADGRNAVDKEQQVGRNEEQRHVDNRLIAVDPLNKRQPHKEGIVEPERQIYSAAQASAKTQNERQEESDKTHHGEQRSVCRIGLDNLRQPHMFLRMHGRRDDERRACNIDDQRGKLLLVVRNNDVVAACERARKDHQKEYAHLT